MGVFFSSPHHPLPVLLFTVGRGLARLFYQLSFFNNRCLEDAAAPPPAGGL